MNVLALGVALRLLLFGGSFLFTLAMVGFIAYQGRERFSETLPWLGLSLAASALTLPALFFTLLGLGTRLQGLATPLACLAAGGVPVALLATGLFVAQAHRETAPPPAAPEPPALDDSRPKPRVQEVCRNPACRAPLTHDERFCGACGWDQDRPVQPEDTLPVGPASSDAPSPVEEPLAYMVVRNGPLAGTDYQLGQETGIGSGAENKISLIDPFVGTEHARVVRKGASYVFYDMSTANGSFLVTPTSKERIDMPHTLRHGDMIQVGDTLLVFMQADKASKGISDETER
jgi:hypothetical protein